MFFDVFFAENPEFQTPEHRSVFLRVCYRFFYKASLLAFFVTPRLLFMPYTDKRDI